MYSLFSVRNFRGFKDFSLSNLSRINLISGKNNAGKTALLEAIWFHHGLIPELAIRLNRFRGISEINPSVPCLEIFRNLDISEKMELSSEHSVYGYRKQVVYTREASTMALQENGTDEESKQAGLPLEGISRDIVVDYDENGQLGSSIAQFTPEEVRFLRDEKQPKRALGRLLVSKRTLGNEEIEGLGQLQIIGKEEEIVSLLQTMEPSLRGYRLLFVKHPFHLVDSGTGTLLLYK
jgi:predicted ATPase